MPYTINKEKGCPGIRLAQTNSFDRIAAEICQVFGRLFLRFIIIVTAVSTYGIAKAVAPNTKTEHCDQSLNR